MGPRRARVLTSIYLFLSLCSIYERRTDVRLMWRLPLFPSSLYLLYSREFLILLAGFILTGLLNHIYGLEYNTE